MITSESPRIPGITINNCGYARVKIAGLWHHLGQAGSEKAAAAYDSLLSRYLANGRTLPDDTQILTVDSLINLYLEHAGAYYVRGGKQTSQVHIVTRALDLLRWAKLTDGPAAEFAPPTLRYYQRYLAADPHKRWGRATINQYATCIVAMFRWATNEGHVPGATWTSLKAVGGLAKNRAPGPGIDPPRESQPVLPVPPDVLAGTLAHAPPTLHAMIMLQATTGMRPCELCAIAPCHIVPTPEPRVFCYNVPAEHNKTEHHDIARKVYLGPKAMAILQPWLDQFEHNSCVFSPRLTREIRLASTPTTRRRKATNNIILHYANKYNPTSYAHAIRLAVHRWAKSQGMPRDQWDVITWSPNQLRHSAATYITSAEKLTTAQVVLGHQDIATTMRYVAPDISAAIAAALAHM